MRKTSFFNMAGLSSLGPQKREVEQNGVATAGLDGDEELLMRRAMPSVEIFFGHQKLQRDLGVGMRADEKTGSRVNQMPGSGNARQSHSGDGDGCVRGINKADLQSDSNFRAEVRSLCDLVTANDERGWLGDLGAEKLYRQQKDKRQKKKAKMGFHWNTSFRFPQKVRTFDQASAGDTKPCRY
jgi:hypothetical protein